MKYAIQINAAPHQSGSASSAYQFIRAALANGHTVIRVFFYGDGVFNAWIPALSSDGVTAPDWAALADSADLDLVFCITAAERRGMLEHAADRIMVPTLVGFRAGGLGLWVEACLAADRVMVFGG
ncbi:MAG: sulfurtransferase complex subunit TusD [Methylococcaceae bacterium]|jgi:tRNA 2-thiouridine synthesizing protein D